MNTYTRKKYFAIIVLTLIVSMVFTMITPMQADASTYNKKCITLTPALNEAALNYVKEIYTDKYPEMSLRFLYGTDQDKKELKTLADKITKGITKDKDKLEAIIDWTNANLDYYIYASAYPMDTFHTRKGNCMSYSLFISQLLRLEGIPSVAVSGWVGDMKELTQKDLYEKLIFEGHAWIYVYVNNKWIMYDPLWYGTKALTDMQFVNENYYPGSIEGINVVPKGVIVTDVPKRVIIATIPK